MVIPWHSPLNIAKEKPSKTGCFPLTFKILSLLTPIFDSLNMYQRVPVFRLGANGLAGPVEYLGMYKFKSLLIGLSFEGFKYYIFKMHRNPDTLNPIR